MKSLSEYIKQKFSSIRWDEFSATCQILDDFDLIEEFRPYWNWKMLSKNRTISWNQSIIERYKLLWDWDELSLNTSIILTNGIIIHFEKFWNWKKLLENSQTPFTWALYQRFYSEWNIDDIAAKKRIDQFNLYIKTRKFLMKRYPTDQNNFITYTTFEKRFLKIYYHDTVFSFGKYKGKTIYEIMCLPIPDFNYLVWCMCNIKGLIFDKLVFYDIKLCAVVESVLLKKFDSLNTAKHLQFQLKKRNNFWPNDDLTKDFRDMCPYCLESPCRCSDPF
jgi:hypothetical protein